MIVEIRNYLYSSINNKQREKREIVLQKGVIHPNQIKQALKSKSLEQRIMKPLCT